MHDERTPDSHNSEAARDQAVTLHDEQLSVATDDHEYGVLRVRKRMETAPVSDVVPRRREQAAVDRIAAEEGDSGEIETLPDGSVSIPILEEELVITKRVVVRERIVIRKETVTEQARVTDDLREEHVEISEIDHRNAK
jgi:uncharacterized protein (TIGR02271 family)